MLTSMTGFGRGNASGHGFEATVEVRSVNSRYAEISVRMPRSLGAFESDVQAKVRERLDRGRINVQVDLNQGADEELRLSVDPDATAGYASLLRELQVAAGITGDIRIEHLLHFSDVFTTKEKPDDAAEKQWEIVETALLEALEDIVVMRRQEGAALARELTSRLEAIERELDVVERRAPARVEEARRRLYDRLGEILSEERIDRDRLEQEIAVLADRLDITEECVRLRSHLDLFREAIAADEAVGRKLNFISQEINREVNTIGSKANDPEIARNVVTMKEELEKLREQIQNVE